MSLLTLRGHSHLFRLFSHNLDQVSPSLLSQMRDADPNHVSSLDGLTRSDFRIAFSMLPIALLSYGWSTINRVRDRDARQLLEGWVCCNSRQYALRSAGFALPVRTREYSFFVI